jgi:putative flippase GtrA
MRLIRLLPERWQKLLRELLKFGIVGGVNAVINFGVFNALILTVFATGQLKANVVATFVATCTSYLMNRYWTFRDRPKSAIRREYALFFVFNATGLAIELGVLALTKYGLGFESLLALNLAKIGGIALATVFRFWSYRTFVFRAIPASVDADDPEPATPPTARSVTEPDTEKRAVVPLASTELTTVELNPIDLDAVIRRSATH